MQAKIKKGFTLIEILLVITLLAILMGIVVLAINPRNLISEVNDNKREADAMTIYQALEQYALKNSAYPTPIVSMDNNRSAYICKTNAPSCTNYTQVNLSSILVPTYMSKIPEYSTDTNNSGFYVVKDSNGKIGIGGVKQVDNTTFVKGLDSQSFATVPTSPIVTNGLVLHLDAGNPASYPGTGTTWTDLSGNNNNGTLVNGVGYNSTNGGSLVFDGFDDYVVTPQISNTGNGTSSQSYCMWIRPNDDNGNILSMSQSNPQMGWNMPPIAVSGSRFRGKFWSNQYLNATSTYVNLQWYYVCLIFSYNSVTTNSYQRLYVNGDLNSEQTNITYSASGLNNFLFFGQQNPGADNTGMFTGLYGIIQIYTNKALTDAEIQQNFNALKGRYGL